MLPGISIRPLQEVQDMSIALCLQRRVWGYSDLDTVPDQIFVAAKESGGQVLGAFDHGTAIGFALAFSGVRCGTVYLHSHMVGVVPEYQNRGVGRLLKLAQRDDALARGIDLIEWTFDPLQLKNATSIWRGWGPWSVNIFQTVTDEHRARCMPVWQRIGSSPSGDSVKSSARSASWQDACAWIARISIPIAIRQVCCSDPAQAEKIQLRVRQQFETHITGGQAAVGFEFDEKQGSYVLERCEI